MINQKQFIVQPAIAPVGQIFYLDYKYGKEIEVTDKNHKFVVDQEFGASNNIIRFYCNKCKLKAYVKDEKVISYETCANLTCNEIILENVLK